MNRSTSRPSNGGLRLRTFGFSTATVLVFGAIRVGIRLLTPLAEPPHPTATVIRSSPMPPLHLDRASAQREAQSRLLFLGREANAARATPVASAAYRAERAVMKGDCPAAHGSLARAGDLVREGDPLYDSLASAARSVRAFCDQPD